jgi:hypothetical protein
VGDSFEDVKWGFLSGCRTCLVRTDRDSIDSCQSGYAHYVVDELDELLSIGGFPS